MDGSCSLAFLTCRRESPLVLMPPVWQSIPAVCGAALHTLDVDLLVGYGFPLLLRRDYGSIMCRLRLHSDTRQFWQDNPDGIYTGPGACGCMAAGSIMCTD
jgi:hypothetical protein